MLNYETLLSTYDDKLTLMQWLKKVEAALKDASAVSFNVNKRGNATITFSVVFEDGSELETDPIILQQGESVTNATITNGHLILTISNGDALDAGNLGAVSGFSINGAQHLIVTYQDGTTQDLGAIFNGNVNIAGTLTTSGNITSSGKITANGDLETTSALRGLSAVITGSVTAGGDITATGKINGYTNISTIRDVDNELRFTEGAMDTTAIEGLGLTRKFAKWALSGTHLMVVVAFRNESGAPITLPDWTTLGSGTPPYYIYSKLYDIAGGVLAVGSLIGTSGADVTAFIDKGHVYCEKNNGYLNIVARNSGNSITLNENDYVRAQFDFIVD